MKQSSRWQFFLLSRMRFEEFSLDSRLLRALAKAKFTTPTPIQKQTIPLALEGKDILARGSTGSGKTLAFLIPVLQKLLQTKEKSPSVKALILLPTKELAHQTAKAVDGLLPYASKHLKAHDVTTDESYGVHHAILMQMPDIVISTPAKIIKHATDKKAAIDLKSVEYFIVDEADLVFSFGYKEDMQTLLTLLPSSYQTFLMSATLTPDLDSFKLLALKNPAIVDINDIDERKARLVQQYME